MLTCLPQSLCSWNYRVIGMPEANVFVKFGRMRERGTIVLDGVEFAIEKEGFFRSAWAMTGGDGVLLEGRKSGMFSRSFEIHAGGEVFLLRAAGWFSRRFEVRHSGRVVVSIRAAHAFTRRAFIEHEPEVPREVVLFSFWLAALIWRRNSQVAASNGSS